MVMNFEPVVLTFLVALRSNGISNIDSVEVFQYNASGDRVGPHLPRKTGLQIFVLDLGHAGPNTTGNYTIGKHANLLMI